MNIIQSIRSSFYRESPTRTLAAEQQKKAETKRYLAYAEKAIARTRQDISSWNNAQQMAGAEDPKNFAIQLLYDEISLDALLTSQQENRTQQVMSRTFKLKTESGEVDEAQTKLLKGLAAYRKLSAAKMGALFGGYNLIELGLVPVDAGGSTVSVEVIPRTNVVPKKGRFYPDYSEDKFIEYRLMPEFGTYILEFNTGTLGLLNKAVPHVLFKRFAQSCWSELCEIYGIPPRVLKTNTQDNIMLKRAEKMMADMGAAAWFIIDDTEAMEWATGTATDGAVYKNLINLCSNELSLLISGAVIGQDTQHGNRSKEEASQKLLNELTQGDLAMCEDWWNTITIPALVKLGILKGNPRFEYDAAEDIPQLWKMTKESLQYFTVDPEWAKSKFGIEITGERQQVAAGGGADEEKADKLKADGFFV